MTHSAPHTAAIVLAAGQGTRMKSDRPKILHELCGKPMVHYVIERVLEAGVDLVVLVVGHEREQVIASVTQAFGKKVVFAIQEKQQGTGDAVRSALTALPPSIEQTFILVGDAPLIHSRDLNRLRTLVDATSNLAMFTMHLDNPTGYGRILRDEDGCVVGIREQKDATEKERTIKETNPGFYLVRRSFLDQAIQQLKPNNVQREYYLTDIVSMAAENSIVHTVLIEDATSLAGINDRAQLAFMESILYERIANQHRVNGITIRTSARIDADVHIEPNAIIEHNVVLRGKTSIGDGAIIDVGSVLTDTTVAAGAIVKPYTIATQASIGVAAQVGPFSHLRPESDIHDEAHVGNFVETKKTIVHRGAKANHLAYLGDGDIGEGANVGAGTIFCNYDGFKKHRTEIGPGAFIGSDSQIVAPIKIGAGAYVATGTTVTQDVPEDALAISRVRQENKLGYAKRLKEKLKAAKK